MGTGSSVFGIPSLCFIFSVCVMSLYDVALGNARPWDVLNEQSRCFSGLRTFSHCNWSSVLFPLLFVCKVCISCSSILTLSVSFDSMHFNSLIAFSFSDLLSVNFSTMLSSSVNYLMECKCYLCYP